VRPERKQTFVDLLKPVFDDLLGIHTNYMAMFERVHDELPDDWEMELPGYASQVAVVARRLSEMRREHEPVRIQLRAVTAQLTERKFGAEEDVFIEAVFRYFPEGSVRPDREDETASWGRSAGTELLDALYVRVKGVKGEEAGALKSIVHEIIMDHRANWENVCRAFASLQVAVLMGPRKG
jgi:hypothetical protein